MTEPGVPDDQATPPESEPAATLDAQTADEARRQWDDSLWWPAPVPRYRP